MFLFLAKKRSCKYCLQNLIKRSQGHLCLPNNACFWDISFHQGLLCRAIISRQEIPWFNVFLLVDHMSRVLATGRMHMRCDLGPPPAPGRPCSTSTTITYAMWAAAIIMNLRAHTHSRCFLPPDLVLHFTWVTHSLQLSIIFPKKGFSGQFVQVDFPSFLSLFELHFVQILVPSHLSNLLFRIHNHHVWEISLYGRPDQRLPRDL